MKTRKAEKCCWAIVIAGMLLFCSVATAHDDSKVCDASGNAASLDSFLLQYQASYNSHNAADTSEHYAIDATWQAAAGVVLTGRNMISVALGQFMMTVPPVLTLDEKDRVLGKDIAVSIGTYSLGFSPTDTQNAIGGAYLNVLRKSDAHAGWEIIHQQMNYNFPVSEAGWVGSIESLQSLPEQGELDQFLERVEAIAEKNKPRKIKRLIQRHAWIAAAGKPLDDNRKHILHGLKNSENNEFELDIHDLKSIAICDSITFDSGWFELTQDEQRQQWGTYSMLVSKEHRNRQKLMWLVYTASPPPD